MPQIQRRFRIDLKTEPTDRDDEPLTELTLLPLTGRRCPLMKFFCGLLVLWVVVIKKIIPCGSKTIWSIFIGSCGALLEVTLKKGSILLIESSLFILNNTTYLK